MARWVVATIGLVVALLYWLQGSDALLVLMVLGWSFIPAMAVAALTRFRMMSEVLIGVTIGAVPSLAYGVAIFLFGHTSSEMPSWAVLIIVPLFISIPNAVFGGLGAFAGMLMRPVHPAEGRSPGLQ